jgi:hypothetical protein
LRVRRGIAAGRQAVAVVLDLVNPIGPDGGSSVGDGRHGSMKPAGADRIGELNKDMAGR